MTDDLDLNRLRELAEAATDGEWDWCVHDHSMATLGVGEMPGLGDPHVLSIGPCKACADRADPKEWEWGRCMTPNASDAAYIAAAHPRTTLDLIEKVERAELLIDAIETHDPELVKGCRDVLNTGDTDG